MIMSYSISVKFEGEIYNYLPIFLGNMALLRCSQAAALNADCRGITMMHICYGTSGWNAEVNAVLSGPPVFLMKYTLSNQDIVPNRSYYALIRGFYNVFCASSVALDSTGNDSKVDQEVRVFIYWHRTTQTNYNLVLHF